MIGEPKKELGLEKKEYENHSVYISSMLWIVSGSPVRLGGIFFGML